MPANDPSSAHWVEDGVERSQASDEPVSERRFSNALGRESLLRIRRVVEAASSLRGPTPTGDLLTRAEASSDQKGALGALRMLDVEGLVHFRPGPRKQLLWMPGPRAHAEDERAALQLGRYRLLREILVHASDTWIATDYLLRTAAFDPDLWSTFHEEDGPVRRRGWDLPVNFFFDNGKSARKYVLGALKALYWRELVAWRLYSTQAVTWRWCGEGGKERGLDFVPRWDRALLEDDPYLTNAPLTRYERMTEKARARESAHEARFQQWVDERYPDAAQRYKDKIRTRQLERERKARDERREAKKWLES